MKKNIRSLLICALLINSIFANQVSMETSGVNGGEKVNWSRVEDSKAVTQERIKFEGQTLSSNDIKEFEFVFKTSPSDAQNIVEQLKNVNFYKIPFSNYVIFVGPPGSGKTVMAKAIAYKMMTESDWTARFIRVGDVIGKVRNQAAENLEHYFDQILASKKKTIIIIDELNELLENAHDSHYDTSATSKCLWQFLDDNKNNPNLFFIGTMNRDTELPQAFKSRICQRKIKFGQFENEQIKFEAFLKNLLDAHINFDESISTEYLKEQVKKLHDSIGRDFHEFALLLKRIYRRHNKNSLDIVISKSIFDECVTEYIKNREEIEYHKIQETEADRQERYFVQRILTNEILRNPSSHKTYDKPYMNYTMKVIKSMLNENQKKVWERIIEQVHKDKTL